MILALDAALKKTGYAVGERPSAIVELGILWSDDKRELSEDRALSMVDDIAELVAVHGPDTFVIEMPAPQAPKFHRRNSRTGQVETFMPRGQADYGVACGTIMAELRHRWPATPIVRVRSDEWSRQTNKAAHQYAAKLLWPGYDPAQDVEADAADAICLLAWHAERSALLAALEVGKAQAKRTINRRKAVGGLFTGARPEGASA